jgi:hypothetical protein
MVGESEPLVLIIVERAAVLYRGKASTRCFGMGSVGQMLNKEKQPNCAECVFSSKFTVCLWVLAGIVWGANRTYCGCSAPP